MGCVTRQVHKRRGDGESGVLHHDQQRKRGRARPHFGPEVLVVPLRSPKLCRRQRRHRRLCCCCCCCSIRNGGRRIGSSSSSKLSGRACQRGGLAALVVCTQVTLVVLVVVAKVDEDGCGASRGAATRRQTLLLFNRLQLLQLLQLRLLWSLLQLLFFRGCFRGCFRGERADLPLGLLVLRWGEGPERGLVLRLGQQHTRVVGVPKHLEESSVRDGIRVKLHHHRFREAVSSTHALVSRWWCRWFRRCCCCCCCRGQRLSAVPGAAATSHTAARR
mmetsp:Transcript_54194/g.107607  ORF Transcript_54194/g.107607 Transcript_54194/m.107607 type:complete len:275 (+) Transcript_54194:372-1196(+)